MRQRLERLTGQLEVRVAGTGAGVAGGWSAGRRGRGDGSGTVGVKQGGWRSGEGESTLPRGDQLPAAGEWGGWGGVRARRLTQARVGVPGRGGPPGPVSMGRAAALAAGAGGVMAAATAGGLGAGGTASCVAMALAAAPHSSRCQPCPAPQLHAEVTDRHAGFRAWWGSEGHLLGAPQGPRPGGSAPQQSPGTSGGPGGRQDQGWGSRGAEA